MKSLILFSCLLMLASNNEAGIIKDSLEDVSYQNVYEESINQVSVKASQGSSYIISIPKETEEEVFVEVNGDIAGDERLHINVINTDIDAYLYWDSLPITLKGRKFSDRIEYKISLEKRC